MSPDDEVEKEPGTDLEKEPGTDLEPVDSDEVVPADQPDGLTPGGLLIPRPIFQHNPRAGKNSAFMVELPDLVQSFGQDTVEHLRIGNRWALRAHGRGIGHDIVDALRFGDLVSAISRATKWIGGRLSERPAASPGFSLARAYGSVVLHFTPGLNEEPIYEDAYGEVFATVEASAYLVQLMASSSNPKALEAALAPLGRRAVGTYSTALKTLVEREIGINTVILPRDQVAGQQRAVRVDLTVDQADEDYQFLSHEPRMVKSEDVYVGRLFAQNAKSQSFNLEPEEKTETGWRTRPPISGRYLDSIEADVNRLANERVRATIRIVAPEYDWLPRAGRTSRTLIAVEAAPK